MDPAEKRKQHILQLMLYKVNKSYEDNGFKRLEGARLQEVQDQLHSVVGKGALHERDLSRVKAPPRRVPYLITSTSSDRTSNRSITDSWSNPSNNQVPRNDIKTPSIPSEYQIEQKVTTKSINSITDTPQNIVTIVPLEADDIMVRRAKEMREDLKLSLEKQIAIKQAIRAEQKLKETRQDDQLLSTLLKQYHNQDAATAEIVKEKRAAERALRESQLREQLHIRRKEEAKRMKEDHILLERLKKEMEIEEQQKRAKKLAAIQSTLKSMRDSDIQLKMLKEKEEREKHDKRREMEELVQYEKSWLEEMQVEKWARLDKLKREQKFWEVQLADSTKRKKEMENKKRLEDEETRNNISQIMKQSHEEDMMLKNKIKEDKARYMMELQTQCQNKPERL